MLARDDLKDAEGQELVQPVSLEHRAPPVVRGLTSTLRKRGKQAPEHERKMRERIARLNVEGRTGKAKRLARMYRHSYDPKYVAALDANKKLWPGMRAKGPELHRIANNVDLRQTQGTATYRAEPKPKGGYRPVVNFDLPARAAQLLLKRAVQPFLNIRPDQYAMENGSRSAACRRIIELAAQGYAWFKELDVRSYYASINPEGVIELLGVLPKGVVEANALSRSVRASFTKTKERISSDDLCKLSNEVRAGIPQGSLLSPLVAEAAIASVLDLVTQGPDWPDVKLVMYLDNIAILGRDQADVEYAADILEGALKRSRLGPLNLHRKSVRSINQGFNFLGTRFIARDRHIHAEVSSAARLKRLDWLLTKLKEDSEPLWKIKKRMKNWGAAMSLYKDGRSLTRAAQWANSVLSYALDHKLRGRALHAQANYQHRALHEPGFVYEHG